MSGSNEVTTSPGSNQKHQVGGVENKEGVAMLVADSGRPKFSAPLHPVLKVTTTPQNLDELVKAQFANLTDAAKAALGLNDSDTTPRITAKRGFLFKALASNNNEIFVGTKHVSAADITGAHTGAVGFQLEAGASIFLEITNGSQIYFDATDSDESLCWLAL